MTTKATLTDRTFGLEIEFITQLSRAEVYAALEANGVTTTRTRSYTHELTQGWKVVTDASVLGGLEVVSPILSGLDGLEDVVRVLSVLDAIGRVDVSCGIHVHVGASDLSDAGVRRLVRLADDAWRNRGVRYLVSPSRRANQYCRALLAETVRQAVDGERVRYPSRHTQDRYQWLNLAPLRPDSYGTVEFRLHQGSLDGEKVAAWVVFCVRMVVVAAEDGPGATPGRRGFRKRDAGETSKQAATCLLIDLGLKTYKRDRYEADPVCAWAGSYLSARHAHFAGYPVPRVRGSLAAAIERASADMLADVIADAA